MATTFEETREAKLDNATRERNRARARYRAASTTKAKREADADLQFWSNKVAFLYHVRG